MTKWNLTFITAVMALLSVSLASADAFCDVTGLCTTGDFEKSNWYEENFLGYTTLTYKGIEIRPYLTSDIELKANEFNWVINESTKEFYPQLNSPANLSEFHYFVTAKETPTVCSNVNQFQIVCVKQVLDFSSFEAK